MKILLLAHRAPYPPLSGAKVRPFEMIRHLASMHQVSVATLATSAAELDGFQGIGPYCARFHASRVQGALQMVKAIAAIPTGIASSIAYFHSGELQSTIRRWHQSDPFDLVLCFSSSMGRYLRALSEAIRIVDFCDLDSEKWFSYASFKPWPWKLGYWLEGTKMRAEEIRLGARSDAITVASVRELDDLSRLTIRCHSDWVSNGVDFDYFSSALMEYPRPQYDPDTLCFLGRMDYFPNEDAVLYFANAVLPLIRQSRPNARLLVIGAAPTAKVRALTHRKGIDVTGTVADVRPYARTACAMVAPLRIARGVQNKILEAMAMGIPTVTSTLAAGGIDAVVGEHLLVSDDKMEFARHCLTVMADSTYRQQLADSALRRVRERHSWSHCLSRLDAVIEHCMQAK